MSQSFSLLSKGQVMSDAQVISLIPIIEVCEINSHQDIWKIYYYKEWGIFKKEWQEAIVAHLLSLFSAPQIQDKISLGEMNFRFQSDLEGMPVTVAFFFLEKEIRLASPRLNLELFLLESINPQNLSELSRQDFKALEKHTEMIASLRSKHFLSSLQEVTYRYGLSDLLENPKYKEIEGACQALTEKLLVELNRYRPALFEKFTDFALGLTASYALLRIHLLKFLAILPSLDHDLTGAEVKRVLLEALRRLLADNHRAHFYKKKGEFRALPSWLEITLKSSLFIAEFIPSGPLASFVRYSVKQMAKRFIAGETIEKAGESLKSLRDSSRDATLDQLGELVVSEKEADHYFNEVMKLIRGWSLYVKKGEKNKAGINCAHVSIKVSALCSDFRPLDFEGTYEKVAPRLIALLMAAKEEEVFLNIDAEHIHFRDLVFEIYRKALLDTPELKFFSATGIVLQAYLRDAYPHLLKILELAKERGLLMPIRLVKGAYWDAETVEASAHGFNAPQFLNKEETDLHFRQLIIKIFEFYPHLSLCLAGHNFSDHAFAEVVRERFYPTVSPIEHQCLHMTYEALSTALSKMGWPVRNYIPVGSLLVGMAYLVRRIMENSSQVGVLTIMRSHKKKQKLLAASEIHKEKLIQGSLERDAGVAELTSEFFNISPMLTYLDRHQRAIQESFFHLNQSLQQNHFVKIEGQFPLRGEIKRIFSPSCPDLLVGEIKFATVQDSEKAIFELDTAYNKGPWPKERPEHRGAYLLKAAIIMLKKRTDLAALISFESGKSASESLADVDEAIDFLNYYGRCEDQISEEYGILSSRGVVAVISPWNFPLAIPCGMISSALVAGNTVAFKPAEQTPLIAAFLVDIFHQAGIPKNVLIHLPGEGETVGKALVQHSRVAQIVFTGSKSVGMFIAHEAGKRLVQNHLYNIELPVKVITEMGGKNTLIVTANAELDETVAGILYSAFGHAGQKCSALSRVLVHNSIKDKLVARLQEACRDLKVGKSFDFSTAVNPIISKEDQKRLREEAQKASLQAEKSGGRVVIDRSQEDLPGFCVGPCIIELPLASNLQDLSSENYNYFFKELFGPILHVIPFLELKDAVEIFNASDYALTGGIFSQSQDDVDFCLEKMEAGNIYVNRSITGARVDIEPFGGFKLSGSGPKAGGRDYLMSFHGGKVELPLQIDLTRPTPLDEKGTDLSFELAKEQKGVIDSRLLKINKSLEHVIRDFEALYQGLYGENKKVLKNWQNFFELNLRTFIKGQNPNRKIPGQASYNDHKLALKKVVVVAYEERAFFSTLLYLFSALAMGAGVSVLCRNSKSYLWWNMLRGHFYNGGLSVSNFNLSFCTDDLFRQLLKTPTVDAVVVDGPLYKYQEVANVVYDHLYQEKGMRKLLTPFDAPHLKDIKSYLLTFVNVRSVAVNTMRHGAPLELNI